MRISQLSESLWDGNVAYETFVAMTMSENEEADLVLGFYLDAELSNGKCGPQVIPISPPLHAALSHRWW